jgi:hypothetical protein
MHAGCPQAEQTHQSLPRGLQQRPHSPFLANQADPRHFFVRINVFCRRKLFWMVQASGRDIDLIGATFGFVSERRSARIAESSKRARVGFVSMRFAGLPRKVGRLDDHPSYGLGASGAPAVFTMTIRAHPRFPLDCESNFSAITAAGDHHGSNENELRRRWRGRAWIGMNAMS